MIEISNVHFAFEQKEIIRGLNLKVEPGERIAIIGPSGCGKSTLLRLMMGLIKPQKGHIRIKGRDISHMDIDELRQVQLKFGMLFQSAALFDSMTVEENVGFSLVENLGMSQQAARNRVRETLEMVEMERTEKIMPAELSGGMKKRIGLARAISAEPEIILYDEPTTGLDPITSTKIEHLIVKMADQLKITSIVVTHQISTILRTADKIYVMYKGQLLPPESPDKIMNSNQEYVREFIRGGNNLEELGFTSLNAC